MATHSTRAAGAAPRALPDESSLRADQRDRRARIIDAAARMMVEVDYEQIQIKDVAERADVALGTLYRYFNSKDHLFACALVEWSAGFQNHIETRSKAEPADRVKAVYRRAVRAFEREPNVYGVLIQIQSSKDTHAAEVFREFSRGNTEAFGVALDGIEAPRRDAIVAVMSAVLATNLLGWRLGGRPISSVYAAIDSATQLIFDPGPPN